MVWILQCKTGMETLEKKCQKEKIHYRVNRFCPTCNKPTPRTGKISLHSPKDETGFPVYRVDYPCECGQIDFVLFYGVVVLNDEEMKAMFYGYPEENKPKPKPGKRHRYPGLFDAVLYPDKEK